MNEHDSKVNRPGDFAIEDPLPPGATEPVDVVQVRADDALIAAMSAVDEVHIDDPIDERLAGLLQSWRDDVRIEPERPLVDLDTAVAALASVPRRRPASRRASPFGPLASAAAVLVVVFVGLGLAARGAEPGDALWNVTKVLYSDKAKSVEAKVTVTKKLEKARAALESGNVTAAMLTLQEAKQGLPEVAAEDGKDQLATEAEQLELKLVSPSSTLPTTPSAPSATSSTTTPPATSTTTTPPAPTTSTTVPAPPPPVEPQPQPTNPEPPPTTEPSSPPAEGGTGETAPGEVGTGPKVGDQEPVPSTDPTPTTG